MKAPARRVHFLHIRGSFRTGAYKMIDAYVIVWLTQQYNTKDLTITYRFESTWRDLYRKSFQLFWWSAP